MFTIITEQKAYRVSEAFLPQFRATLEATTYRGRRGAWG